MKITIEIWPQTFRDQPEAYGDIRRYLFRWNTKLAHLIAQARNSYPGEGTLVSEGPSCEGLMFGRWTIEP